jgi:hypothetical protein
MTYLPRAILILLLVSMQPAVLPMDQASSSQVIVCESLPEEVWRQIFVWVNCFVDNRRLSGNHDDDEFRYIFDAIENLIPYTRVCKATYGASTPLITAYLQLADERLKGQDKHSVLRWAIDSGDYSKNSPVPLYCRLGADINHLHNDGETALTYAIKHEQRGFVYCLVRSPGIDMMRPNRKGQVPIDLAYELDSRLGSRLKDHGGDPENKYAYYRDDKVKRVSYGGYNDYLAQQLREIARPGSVIVHPPAPAVVNKQNLTVATTKAYSAGFTRGCIMGALVCGICCLLYSKCYGTTDDEQAED